MVQSAIDLLVLQGLRLKGFVEAPVLADFLRLTPADTLQHLELAAEAGQTQFRDGARPGWSLTAEGRKENERLLAEELDNAELRDEVTAIYRRFLDLNQPMLAACTHWQVKDQDNQLLNDHGDPEYDRAVIGELEQIHAAVLPICAELGTLFSRMNGYTPRLETAMSRLLGGDSTWFTKPTIDSYHTVWFELHEDLLATLGIDRVSERA